MNPGDKVGVITGNRDHHVTFRKSCHGNSKTLSSQDFRSLKLHRISKWRLVLPHSIIVEFIGISWAKF